MKRNWKESLNKISSKILKTYYKQWTILGHGKRPENNNFENKNLNENLYSEYYLGLEIKIYFFQYMNLVIKMIPMIIGVLLYTIVWESFLVGSYIKCLEKYI